MVAAKTRDGFFSFWLITVGVLIAGCGSSVEPVDVVLHNGKIITVDELHPEVQALGIRGDQIVVVGTNEEVDAYIGETTEVIDLEGQLAVPGFIESHGHFLGVGNAQMQLNLMDVQNWEEIVAMVAAAVEEAQPGQLIRGRGWHQEKWNPLPERNVEGFPLHDQLSEVSPDNPVVLTHASGHATFANARAMEMSGICLLYTSPSPRDATLSRMPSSA